MCQPLDGLEVSDVRAVIGDPLASGTGMGAARERRLAKTSWCAVPTTGHYFRRSVRSAAASVSGMEKTAVIVSPWTSPSTRALPTS